MPSVLTGDALDKMLAWLDPDRDQAARNYESIRHALIKFFQSHACFAAEDLTDETINRVARRVAEGEAIVAHHPSTYFLGVARKVHLEALRHQSIERCAPLMFYGPSRSTRSPRAELLHDGLLALSAEGRELLEAYYLDGRADLATKLGISPNAVRIRVCREKQRLRAYLDHRSKAPRRP